jgi:hypothetical protein
MIFMAGLLGAALLPVHAMAASPFDGTWKADVGSAKMPTKPDMYSLKDGTYTCKTCEPAYTVKADGSDHPVSGHPYFDTVAVTVVNDHSIKQAQKKSGKTVGTSTTTIAPDGKTGTVEFSDSSNTNATPVTGSFDIERVAAGESGSNAISGSWLISKFSNLSDNGITVTYKADGNMLTMTTPTGQSYTAKMDGTEAPYKGDPGVTTVSVKQIGERTIEETDKRDGKSLSTTRSTISSDGNTMDVSSHDDLLNRTTSWTAKKV